MDFRIRPSSKRSEQSQRSLVQLPMVRNFAPGSSELRTLGLKVDALESNFTSHQDLWRRERDISNASYLDLQKRLDLLEYKAFTNQKDIKKLLQLGADNRGPSSDQLAISDSAKAYTQNQISTIKQTLLQERESHKQHAKHQNQIIEQLNRRQMRMDSEIRDLLAKQREDYDHRLTDQLEELRSNETIKQQRIENQYELMKGLISNTQRKILGEFERKLRNETVIKDYIEDKIAELKEQIAMDQRGMLSKESKFVREIKESIESIFAIIKNTQKQLTQELSETQKISASNFKRLSMTVQLVKERMAQQLTGLAQQQQQTQNEFVDMKNFINTKLEENRELIMELEEENFQNASQKGSRVGTMRGSQQNFGAGSDKVEESAGRTSNLEKEFNQWKAITEQKNLNVFKQISSTLKTMKLQWRKENDELTTEVGSFKQSLSNVKKSVPLEIKKSVQTIITIFNNEFDTLAQELDTITELVALSKKQTQKHFKEELKKTETEILKEVKELIKGSQKQTVLVMERGMIKQEEMMRSHVEGQSRYLKELMMQKHNSIQTQVEQVAQSSKKNNLNTNSQLEDFTLKMKSFNENYKDYLEEQRKDDLRKRIELEQNMRKNASSLMDLCYKKCEFLVDGMKQAMEMNQMKDKVSLTRQVQAMREDNEKKMFQTRQQILDDVGQKLDKLAQERESSEEIMHEAFDQQITMVKKTLSNEIGNTKLELSDKVNELVENLNELRVTIEELSSKGSDSTDQLENAIESLKTAVWKIQAMSFSEQAKNKAIMDRMGEDLVDLSANMQKISNELQPQQKK